MDSTDRSAQNQAGAATTTAASTGGQYGSQASQANASIQPTLQSEINNPTGFTPQETNNQLVAGEQGAGGANAGVVGNAGLNATRTRNSGSLAAVMDSAAQRRGQTLSQNALGVQNESANLAQKKQQSALGTEAGLYGTDVNAQLKAMGLEPEDINANVNAGKSGYFQNLFGAGPGQPGIAGVLGV